MPNDDRRALYLRWRPRTFGEVVGQEHVTRTLRNAVRSGAPAHAYLLCGPRGTGKTSIARILYKALNCLDPRDGEPCDRCASCRAAAEGRALDLVEIDAASNRSIDDVRDLREKVRFAPNEARYRVYIVDEAHELTANAWDAFLKTLEEPPPHAIFVLATTEAHKVPATIVSRCQRFNLSRISPAEIRAHLAEIARAEGVEVAPAVLERLSRAARGGLRDAISLLDQLVAFSGQRIDLSDARAILGLASQDAVRGLVEALAAADAPGALAQLGAVVDEGADLRQFADDVLEYLRAALLVKAGAASALESDFSPEDLEWLRASAGRWDAAPLYSAVRSLAELLARTRESVGLRVQLELVALEACGVAGEPAEGARAAAGRQQSRTQREVPAPAPPRESTPGPAASPPAMRTDQPDGAPPPAGRAPAAPGPSEATTVTPPAEPAAAGAGSEALDPAAIEREWAAVLPRIVEKLGPLGMSLVNARYRGVRGNGVLSVGIPDKFHLGNLSKQQNRTRVEQAFREALGKRIRLDFVLDRSGLAGAVDDDLARDPLVRTVRRLWPEARIEVVKPADEPADAD